MSAKASKRQRRLARQAMQPTTAIPHIPKKLRFLSIFLRRTRRFVVDIVAVLGVFGLISLLPRISMFSNPTLDPSEPFATPFGLKNDGYETLYRINFACGVNNLETATRKPVFTTRNVGISAPDLLAEEKVAPNESSEFFCPVTELAKLGEPVTKLDIDIYISFSVSYIPKRFVRCFRFVTTQDNQGHLRWLQKGFGKECHWPDSIMNYIGPREH